MSLVDTDRVLKILYRVPTFAGLYDDEYHALAKACGAENFKEGEVIFHEGDSGAKLYIILAGEVTISTEHSGVIARLKPIDLFGEVAMVQPINRVATATAVSKTTVLTLTRMALEELQVDEPRAAFMVLRNLAAALAEKLSSTNDLIAPSNKAEKA